MNHFLPHNNLGLHNYGENLAAMMNELLRSDVMVGTQGIVGSAFGK